MERPYIFCHMITSIDGKIDGTHKAIEGRSQNAYDFYQIAFGESAYYHPDGWLSGRATSEVAFTKNQKPILDNTITDIPEGDFIVETDLPKYYVSIDSHGKLGWTTNTVQYRDTEAHIIEVLTASVGVPYRAMLRKLGISYIIAGDNHLDYDLTLQKLKKIFHIEILMLGGGGVLNWSFVQAGFCDELSMLIAPYADGSEETHALFQTKVGLSKDIPVSFSLEHVEKRVNDGVWLRYKFNKIED